eukprot:2828871-Karenia_brevis.AAC.1
MSSWLARRMGNCGNGSIQRCTCCHLTCSASMRPSWLARRMGSGSIYCRCVLPGIGRHLRRSVSVRPSWLARRIGSGSIQACIGCHLT